MSGVCIENNYLKEVTSADDIITDDVDKTDEYIILNDNLKALKTGKNDSKFVKDLHNLNLYYKENIIFDMNDNKQVIIKTLLENIISIDLNKKLYYCLKTKELLQNIFDYIESPEEKTKKKKIILDEDDDEDDLIIIKKKIKKLNV
jgi:hypothetical protein